MNLKLKINDSNADALDIVAMLDMIRAQILSCPDGVKVLASRVKGVGKVEVGAWMLTKGGV
jgi:hypothetical protein